MAHAGGLLLRSGRRLGRIAGQAAHGLARDLARRATGGGRALVCAPRCSTCPRSFPHLSCMGATRGSTVPGVVYTANAAPNGWSWNAPPDALLSLLLTVLLFSIARRRNGWTGIHELAERYACRAAERQARRHPPLRRRHRPIMFPPCRLCDASDRTPCTRWSARPAADDCSSAIDPILRRHVWIHEVPPGTPPVEATRRDMSRPGRLHWLAGRRSATENWDAFEAPRGEPFLTASPTSDWRSGASCALEPGD